MQSLFRTLQIKTELLRGLLKKGAKFEWGHIQDQAFGNIKTELVNASILVPFDTKCETILTVDASAIGLGVVLSQIQNNVERTVAFASRTLTTTEINYSVTEREALAAAWAFEYFRVYVWGRKITLRTDHKPLIKVFKSGW